MALALNKSKLDNLAGDIWKSAERLRGKFKAYEYQSVILPIIVIRRLECVLLDWRSKQRTKVLANRPHLTDAEIAAQVKILELNPKLCPFSNKTNWTLQSLAVEDTTLLEANFRDYINNFSQNVEDILEHFNYRATISLMVKNNRLSPIVNQYKSLDLGPRHLSSLEMGYVYEELLRRFSEQSGEEAGEHFTPREVIRLMVELLEIPIPDRHISIYDPACGTGGMLSVAKEHLLDRATEAQKNDVQRFVTLHGQELSPTNYAICQADLLIKNDPQAEVFLGNSLIPHDPHSKDPGDQLPEPKYNFNFMLSNPPFGVTWGGKEGYEKEARKLRTTRYQAGMPRVNDGALLFLETMLAKMQPPDQGGSRIAVIFNGSPLSNGDCGSDESEIRRWILENDWLDAVVMLPDQLFYNTGIFTYIWLLRNEKPADHQSHIMLIDARKQFEKEPKAFGNKRNRMSDAHRLWIEDRYRGNWANVNDPKVKLFRREDFAFHKVKVVFWQTDADDQPTVITEPYEKPFTTAALSKELTFYDSELRFRVRVQQGQVEKTIEFTLKPGDAVGRILKARFGDGPDLLDVEWTHRHYIADDEYIPEGQDIPAFLEREIAKPIIRWEDSPQLGYEILPTKYFYHYEAPTPATDLLAEFWILEQNAEKLLQNLAGNSNL